MTHYKVQTPFGIIERNSKASYVAVIVRKDGWHQFSKSIQAAERELRYQQNKGREVALIKISEK